MSPTNRKSEDEKLEPTMESVDASPSLDSGDEQTRTAQRALDDAERIEEQQAASTDSESSGSKLETLKAKASEALDRAKDAGAALAGKIGEKFDELKDRLAHKLGGEKEPEPKA